MKKKIVLLTGLVLTILSIPLVVLADSWNCYTTFSIEDTGGSNRDCLSPIVAMDIDSLADYGFIASDGMDTRVLIETTEKHYMVVDDQIIVAVEDLNAYETQTMKFYQGYSPVQTDVDLLTGTGGKITVADDADLELGDDFLIEFEDIYLNTDSGSGKYLVYKQDAFEAWVEDDEEIVATINDSSGWSSPTSNTANGWTNPSNAYDEAIGTFAYEVVGSSTWTSYLELDISATDTNYVRFCVGVSTYYLVDFDLDVYYSSSWHDVVSTVPAEDEWVTAFIGSTQSVSSMRIRMKPYDSDWCYIYEADFGLQPAVVATGITTGEHDIDIEADGTDLTIDIDGVEKDSFTLGGVSVTNNSNSIILMDNSTTNFVSYAEYIKWTVNDVLIAEYNPDSIIVGTTLPDEQGGNENGTFTFGSNSNMTVTVLGTTSSTSTTSTTSTSGTADTVLSWDQPSEWEASESSLTSLPFYDDFNSAATDIGWETANLYGYIMIGVAIAAGVGVMALTGSLMLGACIEGAVLLGANNATIIDGWIIFSVFVFSLCLMYITRGRGAVTA